MITAANDLEIYERHGAAWWDESDRTFASLRSVGRFLSTYGEAFARYQQQVPYFFPNLLSKLFPRIQNENCSRR
jgi:hypothetical protein